MLLISTNGTWHHQIGEWRCADDESHRNGNSLLSGLPASTVNILQRVRNAAARLICNLKPCEHVTASLKQLHWLSVKQRVQYKLCMIMYTIHFGLVPLYITELVITVAAQTSCPGLRSADTTNYVQPLRRTKFGERAFSYAGPAVWNLLPDDLHRTPMINSFKC